MMKKYILLFPFLLWISTLNAQQISSSGGFAQKEEFSAEWIIGGFLADNSLTILEKAENFIDDEKPQNNLINVWPNATVDYLKITKKSQLQFTLCYKIVNASGIDLMAGNINSEISFLLDVRGLSPGNYFIIFSSLDDKSFMITKKFIKF